MDRFIHGQNMAHYIDLLEVEIDPGQRQLLTELLIEEENLFAKRQEMAGETTALILKSRSRIAQQSRLVTQLERDGCDAALARRVLENMNDLLRLLIAYRRGSDLQASPSDPCAGQQGPEISPDS